jgi:hypothetical protein
MRNEANNGVQLTVDAVLRFAWRVAGQPPILARLIDA